MAVFPPRFRRCILSLLLLAGCLCSLPARAGTDTPVSSPGVLRLTLDSAIRMALAKNFSIEAEQYGPNIARENVRSELGRFDPDFEIGLDRGEDTQREIFVDGQRLESSSVTTVDNLRAGLTGLTPLGTTYDFGLTTQRRTGSFNTFGEDYRTQAGLGLRQPLLRGFGTDVNLAQVRIARNNVLVSEWQLRLRIMDIVTQLIYVYNDLHLAQENLLVAERSRDLALKLVEENTQRVDIGTMVPLDVTTARAEAASREEAVILATRSIRDNENFVKQLVTSDMERMLSIGVEITPPRTIFFRADVLGGVRDALELRPDYQQALLDLRNRGITLNFLKNQKLPRFDLTGSLSLLGFDNDIGTSATRVFDRDQTAWSAGAIFSVPLGNRTAIGTYNASPFQMAQALVNLDRLEQQIIIAVDNASGQIVTSRERMESTAVASRLAR
ncbi:MAG: TolC family protein, partial [Chthoniobacteraceae bacterium]